jgi:hypothetical protein
MYRRKKDQADRWPKVLLKLSRLYARMRSKALAYFAIAQAERAVRRKIEASRSSRGWTTQGKDE